VNKLSEIYIMIRENSITVRNVKFRLLLNRHN